MHGKQEDLRSFVLGVLSVAHRRGRTRGVPTSLLYALDSLHNPGERSRAVDINATISILQAEDVLSADSDARGPVFLRLTETGTEIASSQCGDAPIIPEHLARLIEAVGRVPTSKRLLAHPSEHSYDDLVCELGSPFPGHISSSNSRADHNVLLDVFVYGGDDNPSNSLSWDCFDLGPSFWNTITMMGQMARSAQSADLSSAIDDAVAALVDVARLTHCEAVLSVNTRRWRYYPCDRHKTR